MLRLENAHSFPLRGQTFQLAFHPAKENRKNTFFSSKLTYLCHFQSSIHNALFKQFVLEEFPFLMVGYNPPFSL